jgi:hypothetical protein
MPRKAFRLCAPKWPSSVATARLEALALRLQLLAHVGVEVDAGLGRAEVEAGVGHIACRCADHDGRVGLAPDGVGLGRHHLTQRVLVPVGVAGVQRGLAQRPLIGAVAARQRSRQHHLGLVALQHKVAVALQHDESGLALRRAELVEQFGPQHAAQALARRRAGVVGLGEILHIVQRARPAKRQPQ